MRSLVVRSLGFALTMFLAIGVLDACGRSTSQVAAGTGGSGGSGATGGAIASGGRIGSGGATQSGGATSMDAAIDAAVDAAQATGGNSSSGGRTGTGGNTQRGGATGTGGAIDADPYFQATLAAAVEQWKAAKKICPAYRYQRWQSSVFGYCSTTAVVIVNDQPVGRAFAENRNGCVFFDGGVSDGGFSTQWEESATQIGSHGGGSPARTVEQLLEECQTIMAQDPSKNRFYLEFNAGGVPTHCERKMKDCFDDCTVGIGITSFSCDVPPGLDASAG